MSRYVLTVEAREGRTGADRQVVRTLFRAGLRERAFGPADFALLARIARVSGGRVLPDNDGPFAGSRPIDYRDASTALAMAGLAMFFVPLVQGRGRG